MSPIYHLDSSVSSAYFNRCNQTRFNFIDDIFRYAARKYYITKWVVKSIVFRKRQTLKGFTEDSIQESERNCMLRPETVFIRQKRVIYGVILYIDTNAKGRSVF